MTIGLAPDLSVLQFTTSDLPPYYVSVGDRSARGLISFDYDGEETEFERSSAVPIEDAMHAVEQFLATDERPTALQWEEV